MKQAFDWRLTNFSTRYNAITKKLIEPYPSSPVFLLNFGSVTTQWKIELSQNVTRWKFYLRLLKMSPNTENHVAQIKVQCPLFIMAPSNNPAQDDLDSLYNQIGSMEFLLGPEIAADGKVVDARGWPWIRGWQTVGWEELSKRVDPSEDTLHVRVNFIYGASVPSIPLFTSEGLAANLAADLGGILASGQDSDMIIKCGSDSFPVHKLVLSMRSPIFKTMLNSGMIESTSGVITVDDINPLVMKLFLDFLYTAKIGLNEMDEEQVIGLITVGDKYQVAGLKEICFQHLITNMNDATCGKLAVASYLHGANPWQKDLIYDYVAERWKSLGTQDDFKELVRAYPDAFLKG